MRGNITIQNLGMHAILEDMKQPLTNIILSAACLEANGISGEEKERLLTIILQNSNRINKNIFELCHYLEHVDITVEPGDCEESIF